MKITLVGPVTPYRGGIAHFTTMLGKKLQASGHDMQVISFKKQYPAWLYPGESDQDHSPGRESVPADYLLAPLNPLSWQRTVRVIRSFKPQQVIFPWWVTFWGPAFHHVIAQLKHHGFPITILIHNTMPHEARPWDRILARRTLTGADRFIVMTEKEKIRLTTLLPAAENITIAPLPIYNAFKQPEQTRDTLRQQLGIHPSEPVILFFGFIRPYKGLHLLIDAFKQLLDSGTKAHLLVVGEFWDDQRDYTQQIETLGITDKVHIVDQYIPDNEITGYFKAADVFAAPYIGGTQSGVLRTALGFGLPCVVTDIIADAFIKSLSKRCIIVPTGNAAAIARGMAQQINHGIQDSSQIQSLVDRSWQGMLAACAYTPTIPSRDARQEGSP